ncbi:MAG: hypothetical protein K0S47_468 [Herbinix sp.]|nr:hypothetical protein [Herbinix sp.]
MRKLWLKYLCNMAIILVIVLLRVYITKLSKSYFNETFHMNLYLLSAIVLINVLLGSLLGLEYLVKEIRSEGTWKINFPKFILLGLPSLYCSIGIFSIYFPNKFLLYFFTKPLWSLLTYDVNILSLFQLMFGYIVVTSFYKESKVS